MASTSNGPSRRGEPPSTSRRPPGSTRGAERGQGQGQGSKGHGAGGRPGIVLVPAPEDLDVGRGGAAHGLAKEGPPARAGLEEGDVEILAQQGENEAGRPVPRPHVQEGPGLRERSRREDRRHQETHALGGGARGGEVDPAAPVREHVEVRRKTAQRRLGEVQRLERRPVDASRRRHPGPGPARASPPRGPRSPAERRPLQRCRS